MNVSTYYARALMELTQTADKEDIDSYMTSLLKLLKRKGHSTLLLNILEEYKKLYAHKLEREKAVLTVARKADVDNAKKRIETYMTSREEGERLSVRINEKLVGGFTFRKGDLLIDASHKRSLINLYKEIIV